MTIGIGKSSAVTNGLTDGGGWKFQRVTSKAPNTERE